MKPCRTAKSTFNDATTNMILKMEDRLTSGAYGDIFPASGGRLAHKVFVSDQHCTNVRQHLTRPEDAERRHKVFLSECEAYRRAGLYPYLRDHIARFDGRCVIQDVTDRARSLAHQYMLDHCYVMEYIEGNATKASGGQDPRR